MNKPKFLLLSLTFLQFPSVIQSQITDSIVTERIANFTKVWGFLKYYHPEINTGSVDWDSVYIHNLENVQSNSNEQYDQMMKQIISDLGDVDTCFSCKSVTGYPNEWKRNFDLSWILESKILSGNTIQQLNYIFENRFQGEGYYCSYAWGREESPVKFKNEKDYPDSLLVNDYRFRLLTLARFWNAIEYFYAYKYLLSKDWDHILKKYIKVLTEPTSLEDYHLNVTRLIHEIEDTHAGARHSRYLLKNKWNKKPPFNVYAINNRTFISEINYPELNKVNDIEIGDEILMVNEVPVNELRKKFYSLCKGSNEVITQRSVDAMLLVGNEDTFSLTIRRKDKIFTTDVMRYSFKTFRDYPQTEKPDLVCGDGYSIVDLSIVNQQNIDSVMEIAVKNEVLIFDLRGYVMVTYHDIAKYLTPVIRSFYRGFSPSLNNIGIFKPVHFEKDSVEDGENFKGKIIVLVNEFTQSRSEFLTIFFQSLPNTIVVGSQTAGADGNMAQIILPGEIYGGFTNIILEYPDGTQCQKTGISIDYPVKMSLEDIENGTDPYIELAIEIAEPVNFD